MLVHAIHHFVRALSHNNTRSLTADVVEIILTLSFRLQTYPGFLEIPGFQDLEDRKLAETTEEVKNASMKLQHR